MKKIFLFLISHACAVILLAQGVVQLGAGANIKTTGEAYLVLDNMSFINNGSFSQAGGDGFVKMSGALDVNIAGSNNTTFNTLLLAKTFGSSLNLQSDLFITSKVNFSGGLLNLNSNILNLGSTGIFSNESEFSRAFTTGTGYIEATGILNAPESVNLGSLGAMISSNATLGITIIRRGHAVQNGVFGSNNSIRRYYDIIPMNNMNLKAVLRFFYFDGELNAIPEPSLHQWKSKDNINWDFVGADAGDLAANYIEKKSINKFERWTLATATAPSITCPDNITTGPNLNGCKASVIFGATVSGIPAPNITYRIGNKIITSPHVFSKGTTTVTATASNGVLPDAVCSFTVTVVCGSPSAITLSEAIPEELKTDKLLIAVRPNPSAHYFTLEIKSNEIGPVDVRIIDIMGREISTWSNVTPNSILNIGHSYRPGIYFVQAIQSKQTATIRLVKQ